MKVHSGQLLIVLVIAYILYNAIWLVPFWKNYWKSDLSWLAFLIWCVPLLFKRTFPNPYLLVAGLILSFLGTIGELKIAQSYALALALGSFYPWSLLTALWLLCGIAWSPSFSWIASQFISYYQISRVVITSIPVVAQLYQSYIRRNEA